jgi:hypothetical protein
VDYAVELLGESAAGVGYLLKDRVADVERFIDSIRRVPSGGSVLDPEVVSQVLGRHRAAGRAHVELAIDPRQVHLDRLDGDEERLRDVPVAMPGAVATAVCGVGARLQDQPAALAPGAMETALAPGANRTYASCVMTGSGPQILAARWKRGSPALRAELGDAIPAWLSL